MVKCMVQSCRNHNNAKPGELRKCPRKFFSFPNDKARVKVWLAALRETEREIPEHVRICEDHFLTHHITPNGISPDAIPIMPPLVDWSSGDERDEPFKCGVAGEDSIDYDEFDEEHDEDNSLADDGSNHINSDVQGEHPRILPSSYSNNINNFKRPRVLNRYQSDVALGHLTKRFMQLLLAAPNGVLDLNEASQKLGTRKRRVYDITNVLDGIQLIKKTSKNKIQWISSVPISYYGITQPLETNAELLKLKSAEESLDRLIKDCAQQLFALTDLKDNADSAYVTYEDICQIGVFRDQTIISVRAPEETKLEVPTPTENSIQIHLKACRGPIHILTCETEGSSDAMDSANKELKLAKPGCFLTLEESRIHTKPLLPDVSSSVAAVQSA
nr:transcription factor E2F6 isoform X1 [Misgurnus anguillicaudatus]